MRIGEQMSDEQKAKISASQRSRWQERTATSDTFSTTPPATYWQIEPAEPALAFVPSRGYLVAGDVWCRAVSHGDRCVNAEGHASSHQFVPGCPHPVEARWWVVRAEVCGKCGAITGTDREAFDRLGEAPR